MGKPNAWGRGMFAKHGPRAVSVFALFVALTLHGVVAEAVLARPDLDQSTYDSLISDMVARIPAHAPEWTDHNASDPGFTLLDLFRFLDDGDLDIIIREFHGRSWWLEYETDSEEFLGELAYSLLEGGLVIVLPANEAVPIDWPSVYSVKLDQTFAQLLASARIPEPATFSLLVLALTGFGVGSRRTASGDVLF